MTSAPANLISNLTSAALSDALGRLHGHRGVLLDMVSPTPGRILFGRAATIRFIPMREDLYDASIHSFARFFYEAVDQDPAGKVLVLDSSGHPSVSVGGGTKFSRLQNHGLAGLITDGRLRDFEELARYDPVFYCRGQTPRAGTGDLMPVSAGAPACLDGVSIVQGDYIFADQGGAVVIPASAFEAAVELAEAFQADDVRYLDTIRLEDPREILKAGSQEL